MNHTAWEEGFEYLERKNKEKLESLNRQLVAWRSIAFGLIFFAFILLIFELNYHA